MLATADAAADVVSGAASIEDVESHYEMLVNTLAEEVMPLYEGRPARFQEALVELNEGRPETALAHFDALAAEAPDDPVLALERGRARLLLGDLAAARDDFERAWRELGDGPLDAADAVSLPALWAEAALEAGDAAAVAERLAELADPYGGRLEIAHLYASALIELARADDAFAYLEKARRSFTGDPRFPLHLARLLAAGGEIDAAIDCLEASVAPTCAGGACGHPRHLPSLRTLAGLRLERGEDRADRGDADGDDRAELDDELARVDERRRAWPTSRAPAS